MKKYIIVGAGGTGSYLVNNLLNYLRSGNRDNTTVILIDGDILEERNLLRQGFLRKDIGKNKAEVLVERFRKTCPTHIKIEAKPYFIDRLSDLTELVEKDDKVTIISCVDNNMARFRILLSQYKLFDLYGNTINFIDAGNDEWHGQTLVNQLKKGFKSPITFEDTKVTYTGNTKGHNLSTIFDHADDWKSTLTRGDHELSCDVITEASPQNIAANMTSAMGIMQMLYKTTHNFKSQRMQFNASKGTIELLDLKSTDKQLESFVEYANGEGNIELFSEKVEEVEQQVEQENQLEENLELTDLNIEVIEESDEDELWEEDELFTEESSIDTTVKLEGIEGGSSSFEDLGIEWEDSTDNEDSEDGVEQDLDDLLGDNLFEVESIPLTVEEINIDVKSENTIGDLSILIRDTRTEQQLRTVLEAEGIDTTTIDIEKHINRGD